jgi:hypothetical protein
MTRSRIKPSTPTTSASGFSTSRSSIRASGPWPEQSPGIVTEALIHHDDCDQFDGKLCDCEPAFHPKYGPPGPGEVAS